MSLDADNTLLNYVDNMSSSHGVQVSSSVLKKALKSLVYEDLKLCQFDNMVTHTLTTIRSRFLKDASDEEEVEHANDADEFFALTLAQVAQKLAKSIHAKLRAKEGV